MRKSRFQEAEQQLKVAIKEEQLQNGVVPPWYHFNAARCIDLQVAFCSDPSDALLKTKEALRYYRKGAECAAPLWGESDASKAVKRICSSGEKIAMERLGLSDDTTDVISLIESDCFLLFLIFAVAAVLCSICLLIHRLASATSE